MDIYGIRNKENGLLADNTTDDWLKAISELIDNKIKQNKFLNYKLYHQF